MWARICYCCGEQLEAVSLDNPNICLSCSQWTADERSSIPVRILELVPIEEDDTGNGDPFLN